MIVLFFGNLNKLGGQAPLRVEPTQQDLDSIHPIDKNLGVFLVEPDAAEPTGVGMGCHENIYLEGWPIIQGNIMFEGHNTHAIGNVGFTTGKESVATSQGLGDRNKHLYIWSNTGDLVFDDIGNYYFINHVPSLANLDSDESLEIVIGANGSFIIDDGIINQISSGYLSGYRPVVLSDINNDGAIDIIEIEAARNAIQRVFIHVRDKFGNDLEGWPVEPLNQFNTVLYSSIAVGDLENDGGKEIVIQLNNGQLCNDDSPTVFVYNSNGSLKWSYQSPYNEGGIYCPSSSNNLYYNDVALGDVDSDGFLEVVYFQAQHVFDNEKSHFFVFDHLGNIQAQWDIDREESYFFNEAMQQIALGDLDKNGDLEIVVTGLTDCQEGGCLRSHTFAFNHDGSLLPGFPANVPEEFTSQDRTTAPMIADVDGDGFPEIISSLYDRRNNYYNRIYAWDRFGQLLDCWPKELIRQSGTSQIALVFNSQTTLVDLDMNGNIDLIAPIGSAESHGIDLGFPVAKMEWPMYRHDPGRTGCYECLGKKPKKVNVSEISIP